MGFTLLSLNSFGIPFYLSSGRIKRLAIELDRLAPSVICLQEVQQNTYLSTLQQSMAAYPHHAFVRDRFAPKGGLFTASRLDFPMRDRQFYPFSHRGKLFSIGFSDYALNKGVLAVDLEIEGQRVIVMNTHLQANYLSDWQPTNLQTQIQLAQIRSLSEFVHNQPEDAWVFVCGDFNFPRMTPAYQHLMAQSGLIDAFADDPRPTYQPLPLVSSKWNISLDYFLYRMPESECWRVSVDIIPIADASARWPLQRFLTDHCALRLNVQ